MDHTCEPVMLMHHVGMGESNQLEVVSGIGIFRPSGLDHFRQIVA